MSPYFYNASGDKKNVQLFSLEQSLKFILYLDMAESAKGQDETNPAFLLATRAGEMDPSSPLEISRVGPERDQAHYLSVAQIE